MICIASGSIKSPIFAPSIRFSLSIHTPEDVDALTEGDGALAHVAPVGVFDVRDGHGDVTFGKYTKFWVSKLHVWIIRKKNDLTVIFQFYATARGGA